MSDDEDYETPDEGHGMREEDMESWGLILRVKKRPEDEDSSSERSIKKARTEISQTSLDAKQDNVAPESQQLVLGEEENTPDRCIMLKLISRSSSGTISGDLATLRLTDICSKCAICTTMRQMRVRISIPGCDTAPLTEEHAAVLRFWNRVDMFTSKMYWVTSQVDGDTRYPLTQQLHKDAILDHPFMDKFNDKFKLKYFKIRQDIPFKDHSKILNAIQTEELRLNKGLVCTASHYGELAMESRARSKLMALNVMENIIKSLRILWLEELRCRKAALEDI